MDRNGIAFLEGGDTVAHRRHPAGVLVAERERSLESQILLSHAQIRVADAGAPNPAENLSQAG
jgi:hypothetical protein